MSGKEGVDSMGDRTLVVRQGDLEALESALQSAHETLDARVRSLTDQVRPLLTGWNETTASRQAQVAFEHDLTESLEQVTASLATIRAKLAEVREDAHDTEVRCVAILD